MSELWKNYYFIRRRKRARYIDCNGFIAAADTMQVPAVRRWALASGCQPRAAGVRTFLIIFLAVLCIVLLGVSIWIRFSWKRKYADFRMRVYEKKVTEKGSGAGNDAESF